MSNRFIPFISVLMTISMIVFVTLQLYWIKELYSALNQDFSNKVYSALESSAQKVAQIEVDKYLNDENKNFAKTIVDGSNQPNQTYIQQNSDSANRTTITFQKSIIENQNIPIVVHMVTLDHDVENDLMWDNMVVPLLWIMRGIFLYRVISSL